MELDFLELLWTQLCLLSGFLKVQGLKVQFQVLVNIYSMQRLCFTWEWERSAVMILAIRTRILLISLCLFEFLKFQVTWVSGVLHLLKDASATAIGLPCRQWVLLFHSCASDWFNTFETRVITWQSVVAWPIVLGGLDCLSDPQSHW